ncbi:hypothetical protein GBA52_005359 [Prunus armeniaca]|nr:hypothetical protein GBA52_005359 [Prunus armeniaca]
METLLLQRLVFFPWVLSPAHAKAFALREAFQFVGDMSFNHLQVECDALELVQSLSRTTVDTSSIGSLVEDCKAILALLPNTYIMHISRMANKVAHRLAQLSLTLTSASTWSWEPPVIFTNALVEDSLCTKSFSINGELKNWVRLNAPHVLPFLLRSLDQSSKFDWLDGICVSWFQVFGSPVYEESCCHEGWFIQTVPFRGFYDFWKR